VLARVLIPISLVALLVAAVGYPAMTAFSVYTLSHRDEMHAADAIVVLGAAEYDGQPSPVLQARLDHALYLYRQGMAPFIITTGGNRPGDVYTEAAVGSEYLAQHGVPRSRLFQEDQGQSTYQSISRVAKIGGAHDLHSVLLVSDPLHSARVQRMALDLGFRAAYTSPDSYLDLNRSTNTKVDELVHETGALLAYELGVNRG
jgi:vancomycin permeability regulator SanA